MRKMFAVDRGAGISKSRDQLRQKLLEIHRFADICKSGFAQRRSKVTKKKDGTSQKIHSKKSMRSMRRIQCFCIEKIVLKKIVGKAPVLKRLLFNSCQLL